jgi:hypothetical protein
MLVAPPPAAQRRDLPQVTLCCVDTRTPELALYAMRRCMAHLAFARCVLVSTEAARALDLSGIELVTIAPLRSIDDYSRHVLKGMAPLLHTSHMLLIQWDGFVRDAQLWTDDFLDFDYIGAPWVSGELAGQVGNGGFTLRSRKLLQALQEERFAAHNPEDLCLAVTHRAALEHDFGICFADLPTAQRFACERGPWRPAFGFHAMFNLPHVFTPAEMRDFVQALPPELTGSPDARHLIKQLMQAGQPDAALARLRKRRKRLGVSGDLLRLRLRIGAQQLIGLRGKTP